MWVQGLEQVRQRRHLGDPVALELDQLPVEPLPDHGVEDAIGALAGIGGDA